MAVPGVCAEFEGISPALFLDLWVPPEVLCLPCRMVPGPAVPQQEPLLGPFVPQNNEPASSGPVFSFSTTSFLCKCCVFHEIDVCCFQA